MRKSVKWVYNKYARTIVLVITVTRNALVFENKLFLLLIRDSRICSNMPMARNKKSLYDQLRDREKERENCDSIPMLVNKFLTANCKEEQEI